MALERLEFPELGIDIEIENLGAIFKFFPHKEKMYFGQCVVTTGGLEQGFVKGLESTRMPLSVSRKNLDIAIRAAMKAKHYSQGVFQRKKPGKDVVTITKNLK